ncbi:MAG: hypothetical protein NUV53_02730 [Patescibacteria group bacterium]|nr:hypothetical protein [Patescibacteria group bacterium]
MNSETRNCQNCSLKFVIEPDDFSFYEKIGVPAPTLCPDCRFQRRLLWRNERTFYRRACDLCKRSIIAVYPASAERSGPLRQSSSEASEATPVYCQKCWWSDTWNPLAYGQDIDFSRPFFEQVKELWNKVPAISIQNDDGIASTNCEYAYDWAFSKNTYMSVCGWYTENCLYTYYACYDKDIMDCYFIWNSEIAYELVNCGKCYNSKYCTLCFDCTDCTLSYDLRGCSHCTMCVGLRSKQYCILNQQYSKEEYEMKLKGLNLGNRDSLTAHMKEFREFSLRTPKKFANLLKSVLCTGDNLITSKNSRACFYAQDLENCRHTTNVDGAKDSHDCNNTGHAELCYDSVTPDNSRGNKFSIFCWKCTEAEYSNNCHSCTSVLGSTALKHTSYAILNKQYSKEEFTALRTKLIEHMKKTGEWGEFFPRTSSPHAYNETAALEWFPLTQEEALTKGHRWKDDVKKEHIPTKTELTLPKTIAEVDDSILNEIIECAHKGTCNEKCTTAFKIIPAELQIYRKLNVPIPTLCPNCRHYARLAVRNPAQLWKRNCMCTGTHRNKEKENIYENTVSHFHGEAPCPNTFETSFAPERAEIIYCEQCYNAEIA